MDKKVLFVLAITGFFLLCKARDLETARVFVEVLPSNDLPTEESQHVETVNDGELCLACEEFASDALYHLSDNKTQTTILGRFHKYCSIIPSFKEQCVLLVNYYGDLFFSTLDSVQPAEFCRKFGLCEGGIPISSRISKTKCDVCHDFVTEALLKLKDPDTELEVVKVLLKACDSIGKSVSRCKKLVLEYAPLILINAEEFLEKKDVCILLHACNSTGAHEISISEKTLLFSAS